MTRKRNQKQQTKTRTAKAIELAAVKGGGGARPTFGNSDDDPRDNILPIWW